MLLGWLARRPAKSSKAYWARAESYPVAWGARAALAARHIPPGSSVIDIGCGRMQLRDQLPAGCRYTPADMTRWTDEVVQVDLDQRQFPAGSYDVVTLLGVLEYLKEPGYALARAAEASALLITTYCHPAAGCDIARRRQNGWINDFDRDAFVGLLAGSGWSVRDASTIQESRKFLQAMYVCVPTRK